MVARCRGRAQVEMGVQKDVIVSETVDPGQAPVNQKLCNSRFSNVCNFLEKKMCQDICGKMPYWETLSCAWNHFDLV